MSNAIGQVSTMEEAMNTAKTSVLHEARQAAAMAGIYAIELEEALCRIGDAESERLCIVVDAMKGELATLGEALSVLTREGES